MILITCQNILTKFSFSKKRINKNNTTLQFLFLFRNKEISCKRNFCKVMGDQILYVSEMSIKINIFSITNTEENIWFETLLR